MSQIIHYRTIFYLPGLALLQLGDTPEFGAFEYREQ